MPDANPVFDLGNPIWIQVVAVAETPDNLKQYAGRIPSVPNGTAMPPVGTRGILRVSGVDVTGYLREAVGGYEWVMLPAVDPLELLVDSLPGVGGWANASARQTWLDTARYLRGRGVPGADLNAGLPALYNAAKANTAAVAASPKLASREPRAIG